VGDPAAWNDPVDPVHPGRGHQFYGGDLDGAADKLDHLVDLGVTALYHTPCSPPSRIIATTRRLRSPSTPCSAATTPIDASSRQRTPAASGSSAISPRTTPASRTSGSVQRTPSRRSRGAFYYFHDEAHTVYETWLDAETLPKFDWHSDELRRRFIDGPDSVVGRWLCAPFGIDGWRIDVANMTGRRGVEDLNTEVRQTLRRTMIGIQPDTLLLAESTNDAATDLQGDAWHGGMTYPAFTRGVWSWLADPRRIPHYGFDGQLHEDMWFFGLPTGMPRYDARQFVAQYERFTSQIPWRVQRGTMSALDTHDTARFATYASPGAIPVAVGLSMALPGIPVVYAGDEFGLDAVDGEMSRAPIPWHRVGDPDVAARIALYRDLIGLRRAHPALASAGCAGCTWTATASYSCGRVRQSACWSSPPAAR
jgi:alpha-glucosidase